jgi:hypothetical protein
MTFRIKAGFRAIAQAQTWYGWSLREVCTTRELFAADTACGQIGILT